MQVLTVAVAACIHYVLVPGSKESVQLHKLHLVLRNISEILRIRMLLYAVCMLCVCCVHPCTSCDPVCVQGSDVQQLSSQAMRCISSFPNFCVSHGVSRPCVDRLEGSRKRGDCCPGRFALYKLLLVSPCCCCFVCKSFKVLSVAVAT